MVDLKWGRFPFLLQLQRKALPGPILSLTKHNGRAISGRAFLVLGNWAEKSGYRYLIPGDEAAKRKALKEWIAANPDFLGRAPSDGADDRPREEVF